MLQITIPFTEFYDEAKNEFITIEEQTLTLEHSLVSLSKWESNWCKPFLAKEEMTEIESLDYIRCMTLTENVAPEVYQAIPDTAIKMVSDYISKRMTATWFSDDGKKGKKKNNRPITSEVIYCWMVTLNIPVEFENWHLNRLLTLIRVCDEENKPTKKRSTQSILDDYAALNNANKKRFHTKG